MDRKDSYKDFFKRQIDQALLAEDLAHSRHDQAVADNMPVMVLSSLRTEARNASDFADHMAEVFEAEFGESYLDMVERDMAECAAEAADEHRLEVED